MHRMFFLLAATVSLAAAACTPRATEMPAHDPASMDHGSMPTAAPASTADLQVVKPSANYPLKTCVVSGEKLGGMGDATAIVYKGTEVQFCCPSCVDDFKKDPEKYLAQVRAAGK